MRACLITLCLFALSGCASDRRRDDISQRPCCASKASRTTTLCICLAIAEPTDNYTLVTCDDRTLYVAPAPILTERDVLFAEARHDQLGRPCVLVTFSDTAGKRMATTTRANIGRHLVIFVDDELMSCVTIQSSVSTRAQISGDFTEQRARDIAIALDPRTPS